MRIRIIVIGFVLTMILSASANADYMPTMPALPSETFGTVISASPSFDTGYHWDDLSTPGIDERDVVGHYLMPSTMSGKTAGDALDYHWVWVNVLGDNVTWDMGALPVYQVRVYPSQDHGPYLGVEFDEFNVWGSNDLTSWTAATETALYYDDINNIRTHDGIKDFDFAGAAYSYIKLTSAIDADFEIDAVSGSVVPVPSAVILGSLGIGFATLKLRKRKEL